MNIGAVKEMMLIASGIFFPANVPCMCFIKRKGWCLLQKRLAVEDGERQS